MKPSDECSSEGRMFIRVFQNHSQKGGKEVREMVRAETLSERIRAIRKSKGLSLEDVASSMGMSRQAVWRMEKNPLGMQMKNMMLMANAIGCHVTDFFSD